MKKGAQILKRFFERKKTFTPAYSLRALARDLQMSPAFLSEVFAGKKRLAFERIARVAQILDMDPEAVLDLKQTYVPEKLQKSLQLRNKKKRKPKSERVLIGKRSFKILRQWYYLAILDLTTCADYDGTVEQLAERLQLHLETASVATRELIALGLLVREEGKLKKSHESMRFASAVPREDIRNYHSQMLDKAKSALGNLEEDVWAKRMITGISCAADPQKIEIAKKKLSDCLHEISEYLSEGEGCTEVYHLSAQLFPVTK